VTQLEGYTRAGRRPGARNHVLILPTVVCAVRLSHDIADVTTATTVSHQHGCGHIGPDIVQARMLYAGLATNPNVAHAVLTSLGCETVQGASVAQELDRRGFPAPLVGIQSAGGYDSALADGIAVTQPLVADAGTQVRAGKPLSDLLVGLSVSREDDRVAPLVAALLASGASVVVAGLTADGELDGADVCVVGEVATGSLTVVTNAGAGAQQLASLAACGAQVIVDFVAAGQPSQGFPVVPVVSVGSDDPLHLVVQEDFDLTVDATTDDIADTIRSVFSGAETRAEARGSSILALPRLLRTM
jgi:altronate dehydratase large subunit